MIVRITGGIGNQMFQYAFKKEMDYISNEKNVVDLRFYDKKNIHNGYELNRVFNISEEDYRGEKIAPSEAHPIFQRFLYKIGKRFYVTNRYAMEILLDYYDNFKSFSGRLFYLDGYWQSEDYFIDISEEIHDVFSFSPFDEEQNIELEKKIKASNSVAVHVRRGDFLSSNKYVCLGRTDYYQKAIEVINNKVKDPYFIVLSDDIDWCKNNLVFPDKCIFVDWNIGQKSYRDMQIMTVCKHCIIANSSFSWWGGWLNNNQDKIIIAPFKFYKGKVRNEDHLLPKEWIKIQYSDN